MVIFTAYSLSYVPGKPLLHTEKIKINDFFSRKSLAKSGKYKKDNLFWLKMLQ